MHGSTAGGCSPAATDQAATQQAEAPPAEVRQNDPSPAGHDAEKQSTEAKTQGAAQAAASKVRTAKTVRRSHLRRASRGFERPPLAVMTLRTIELPDGRRMTRLIPYRGGDGYRYDGPAMAFGPYD